MKIKFWRFGILLMFLVCSAASGASLGFTCLTNNSGTCSSSVVPYFDLNINDLGGGKVQFLFSNSLPGPGRITTAYIDEGSTDYFSTFAVVPTAGTSFSVTTSGTLPGGNGNPYFFSTDHGANRTGGAANGVDSGQLLNLTGTLRTGITFADVISGLADSPKDKTGLRVGVHVISLPGGYSEGLMTGAAVPEPGTWSLLAVGMGCLVVGWRRKRA